MAIKQAQLALLLLLLANLVLTLAAETAESTVYMDPASVGAASGGTMDIDDEEETMLDSESLRRVLSRTAYISYSALLQDSIPCGLSGPSYYQCHSRTPANPYTRGCSIITHCARYGLKTPKQKRGWQAIKMKVTVVMGGYEFGMEVGSQEPILEMKRRIQNLLGVPTASQTLSVFGWELLDGLDMEDYPIILEGTRIDLSIQTTQQQQQQQPSNTKVNITVKFSARKINIEVDATDTVRSLKEKIHIIDGTPIKRMALFFSGNELEEEYRSLSDCGIGEFSEVIVYLKTMSRAMADPPSRKISFVVQTSSSLLNAASIPVEISDLTTVNDLMQSLLSRKILPHDDYIFIHKQRIMRESCSLRWHGVENGDCLYVFKGTVSSG